MRWLLTTGFCLSSLLLASCHMFIEERGQDQQLCFEDNTCFEGLICKDSVCIAAGEANQPCLLTPEQCVDGLRCVKGFCVVAGHNGQPCLKGGTCSTGHICVEDQCIGAGSIGQPCYEDDTCEMGHRCLQGMCVLAGNEGLPCLDGGICGEALVCIEDVCVHGGEETEPCFEGGVCQGEGLCFLDHCWTTVWFHPEATTAWMNPPLEEKLAWEDAYDACDGSEHAGSDAWRLPTREELQTLYKDQGGYPDICHWHDGLLGKCESYWTGEAGETEASYYSFDHDSNSSTASSGTLEKFVRCVWVEGGG